MKVVSWGDADEAKKLVIEGIAKAKAAKKAD